MQPHVVASKAFLWPPILANRLGKLQLALKDAGRHSSSGTGIGFPWDKATLQALRTNVEHANDAILKARRQNAFNSCYDAASEGLLPLPFVYASLKEILAKAD